ncbi:hypothetical protein BOX15_Mlig011704g3, partial [Macrostomum lignano]
CNKDKTQLKLVCASTLHELKIRGCEKLGIEYSASIHLVTPGGHDIDDDEFLPTLSAEKSEIIFLLPEESIRENLREVNSSNISFDNQEMAAASEPQDPERPLLKKWPTVYSLPSMPILSKSLQEVRQNCSSTDVGPKYKTNATFVNNFLRYIIKDVYDNYKNCDDPYLTCSQIEDICKAIITTYPALSDATADGTAFWRQRICRRLKEFRSKIVPACSSPLVQQMRMKHGRKRRHAEAATADAANSSAATDVNDDSENSDDSDNPDENQNPKSKKRRQNEDADECGSVVSLAKSCNFNFADCENIPETHETARLLFFHQPDVSMPSVLERMRDTFTMRIARCQNLTVAEEIELYQPLVLAPVIEQEAWLMIEAYNANEKNDYYLPDGPTDIGKNIRVALIRIWDKRDSFRRHRLCTPIILKADNGDVSAEEKLTGAVCILLGRLKVDPTEIFSPDLPVHVIKAEETWWGVSVNGASLQFNSVTDTIIVFICCFIAFNLQHLPKLEAFLEAIEVLARLHKQCAVSRKPAASLVDSFR